MRMDDSHGGSFPGSQQHRPGYLLLDSWGAGHRIFFLPFKYVQILDLGWIDIWFCLWNTEKQ